MGEDSREVKIFFAQAELAAIFRSNISQIWRLKIDNFKVVQKRRSAGFEALNLSRNIRSGCPSSVVTAVTTPVRSKETTLERAAF